MQENETQQPADDGREFSEQLGPLPEPVFRTTTTGGAFDHQQMREYAAREKQEERRKSAHLADALREVYELAGWHYDADADPEDTSPDDMIAHINGLIRKACDRGFEGPNVAGNLPARQGRSS